MYTPSQYTYSELNQMRQTKGELFAQLQREGIEFDYALPQDWLNEFSAYCEKHNPIVTYHLISSTTVWAYGNVFGTPVTVCSDVQVMLDRFYNQ